MPVGEKAGEHGQTKMELIPRKTNIFFVQWYLILIKQIGLSYKFAIMARKVICTEILNLPYQMLLNKYKLIIQKYLLKS